MQTLKKIEDKPSTAYSKFEDVLKSHYTQKAGIALDSYIQERQYELANGNSGGTGGISSPYTWWNIWSLGPFLEQPLTQQSAYLPLNLTPDAQVLEAGKVAYVVTILFLNPEGILSPEPGLSPGTILSNFSLPYRISYNTADLTHWRLADVTVDSGNEFNNPFKEGNLTPGQMFYVDILKFSIPENSLREPDEGLMEMNITARLLGDLPKYRNAPQFAAFATWTYGFNQQQLDDAFKKGDHPSNPLKFLAYKRTP